VVREYAGTIPDKQLIEEIGLALAIFQAGPALTHQFTSRRFSF
jgi:hypothetical protein